jgi:DNA-binding MarR family transcriptional regulator
VDWLNRTQGGFLISKIHQLSGRVFAKLLKEAKIQDINPAQGRILFVLWEKDNIHISKLAEKTQLHKATLTKMLDRLEEQGHIQREPSKEDRRITLIKSTEKNKSLKSEYDAVSEQMREIYYKGFESEEVTQLDGLLTRILDNLIQSEKEIM